jgi:S1-C subfamily serine protease
LRYISRGEQRRSVTVELRPGWRQTDRSWREFQGRVRFNPGFLVEKLDRAGREALGLDADMLALKVTAYYWNTPGDRAGLGVGDVIVAVNGTTVSLTPGQFYSLLRATEADMATLTVQRGNQRVSLRLELQ